MSAMVTLLSGSRIEPEAYQPVPFPVKQPAPWLTPTPEGSAERVGIQILPLRVRVDALEENTYALADTDDNRMQPGNSDRTLSSAGPVKPSAELPSTTGQDKGRP